MFTTRILGASTKNIIFAILIKEINMDGTPNKYICVAYELYVDGECVERAPESRPFRFISGMGTTLDAFEAQIKPLHAGDSFNFTLSKNEAYGNYEPERVIVVKKETFYVDGRFDDAHVYPGSVVPLMNSEGTHFNGTVAAVNDNTVKLDLNHPLAGKALHFVGHVTESREATRDEIEAELGQQQTSGCGCSCNQCEGHGCSKEHECEGCAH